MIRKFLFLCLLLFVIVWIAGAHLIKSRISSVIKSLNTDNISFSYDNINISGFPFCWKYKITNPKISDITNDASYDVGFGNIAVSLSYNLKNIKLNLGDKIYFIKHNSEFTNKNIIISSSDIEVDFVLLPGFAIVRNCDLDKDILFSSIESKIDNLKFMSEDRLIMNLKVFGFKVESDADNVGIQLASKVRLLVSDSKYENIEFSSNIFYQDNVLSVSDIMECSFLDKEINISEIYAKIENSELKIKGKLDKITTKDAEAKLDVNIMNYRYLFDKFIPSNIKNSFLNEYAEILDIKPEKKDLKFNLKFSNEEGVVINSSYNI